MTNSNQLLQNQINQKAFSNQNNINGVFGQAIPGTYNRQVGSNPNIVIDPLSGQQLDQTDDALQPDIAPPVGVNTAITPNYEIKRN